MNDRIENDDIGAGMIQKRFKTIAVLGAGAWGTALAQAAARAGLDVVLWGRDSLHMAEISAHRINQKYLPGVPLEEKIRLTSSLGDCAASDLILLVTPTQTLRSVCELASGIIPRTTPIVICAKGIEIASQSFVSDVVEQVLPHNPLSVLSGPSFANDVAAGLPTAITIAAYEEDLAGEIARCLGSNSFRLYHSNDVRGVEIGGAAKNVLAIACGVAEGRGLGASAKAALVARGFAELRRFGAAFDAEPETLMGLSGLGDLVLTCSSVQSRNFAFGVALGRGTSVSEALSARLAEGAFTARVLVDLAGARQIDMPIANSVTAILEGRMAIDEAISALMARPQRHEGRDTD